MIPYTDISPNKLSVYRVFIPPSSKPRQNQPLLTIIAKVGFVVTGNKSAQVLFPSYGIYRCNLFGYPDDTMGWLINVVFWCEVPTLKSPCLRDRAERNMMFRDLYHKRRAMYRRSYNSRSDPFYLRFHPRGMQ